MTINHFSFTIPSINYTIGLSNYIGGDKNVQVNQFVFKLNRMCGNIDCKMRNSAYFWGNGNGFRENLWPLGHILRAIPRLQLLRAISCHYLYINNIYQETNRGGSAYIPWHHSNNIFRWSIGVGRVSFSILLRFASIWLRMSLAEFFTGFSLILALFPLVCFGSQNQSFSANYSWQYATHTKPSFFLGQ